MKPFIPLLFLSSLGLLAQTAPPFGFRFQQGQSVTVLNDGGTITLPADAIAVPVSGTLSVTYRGATGTSVTINSIDLTGSLDFTVTGFASAPFNIIGGDTLAAGIRYTPASGNRVSARLVVNYTENRVTNSFSLNLVGVAPDFAFSYTPPGGNAQPLVSGATLTFPQTVIDATATATLLITNRGSGSGVITSMSSTGAAFQLAGAPLPGTLVEGGRELRVGIAFTPKQTERSTGTVSVALFNSQVNFNLEGTGATSQFSYELLTEAGARPVLPEELISLPDANVNEKSSVVVRVTNTGNADGRIAAIAASGTGISVSDAPPLPATVTPGNRFTFSVNFNPTAAGKITGRLRIGQDQFDLAATGLGPVLTYAYVVSGVTTTIQNNGSVNFVPTAVGATNSLEFQISNTGTAPGSVTSVAITSANSVFELARVPAMPLTLAPGASSTFAVSFAPTALGSASATLRVDAQTFNLTGTGTSPAALPEYRFEGAAGTQDALQQPALSMTLASPYPLALSGTLTLAFNSDVFSNDPSVQFANGGRTVNFTIPANTTRFLFPNNATQVRLQTGTLAGAISLTPSFATDGGINLTPTRPASLTLTVAPAAPRILGVSIAARTGTTVTLLVSGYATSRSVTAMDLTFTAVTGETLATQRISINAESAFLAWYQSTASQAFGSLFTATVPLTLTGETVEVTSLLDAVQSISVTIANRNGTSPAQSVSLK